MQSPIESPRDSLTAAEVTALIGATALEVDAGIEILDADDEFVADMTTSLVVDGSSVAWEAVGTSHRRCSILLTEPFDFGAHRMRPYMTLTSSASTARFNLGSFVPVSVERSTQVDLGETYRVSGLDKLALLATPIGATTLIGSGSVYVDEVEELIAAIDPATVHTIYHDGTEETTTMPADRIWELGDEHTYLSVANGLLHAIGYRGLWVDHNGIYRVQGYLAPATRPAEWTYDLTTDATASADRTEVADWWAVPNRWTFVRDRPAVGVATTATDGTGGLYVVSNTSDGPTSSDERGGIVRRRIVRVDAADQTGLTEQADRIVADDKRVVVHRTLSVEPNPLHGHHDVVELVDDVFGSGNALVRSWDLPLNGDQMSLTVEMI